MPRYTYHCNSCDKTIETMHSIKEVLTKCTFCGEEESLVRIPAQCYIKTKPSNGEESVGSLVERAIEEGKEELKQEKQKLQTEIYKVPVKNE